MGDDVERVVTWQEFAAATGRAPEDDDLERCNCPKAGMICHSHCGWSEEFSLPQFMLDPLPIRLVN